MRQKIFNNIKNNLTLYKLALFMGLTGYGGMAIIEKIKKEYVTKHKIIDERKFLQSLGFAQILPGSTIISLISYFSYLKAGLIGAIVSTSIYILPTFIVTTILSAVYFAYGNFPLVSEIVKNLNILLIALLIFAFAGMSKSVYFRDVKIDIRAILITLIIGTFYYFYDLSMILIVALSGMLGIVLYFFTGYFKGQLTVAEIKTGQFFLRKKAWALLILSILFFSVTIFYFSEPLWALFTSFFKIGSLAFGGGVAAIPLMENNLVHDSGWFTQTQFWDGIAISQITPGPILIAAAFFGYRVNGIMGALVSTIAICIPSFILVILFGKIYERIKHLGLIRGIFRGFLSGFLGVLLVLIISQFPKVMVSWQSMTLFVIDALLILQLNNGLVAAMLATVLFSFLPFLKFLI